MSIKHYDIRGKQYPVIFNLQALMWFADWLGVSLLDIDQVIFGDTMTERKGVALMYSGLVAGSEQENKRLDISFSEFQEFLFFDDKGTEVSELLGTQFQDQFEVTVTKIMQRVSKATGADKKKEAVEQVLKKARTTKKSS